jgi:hypothetical protein
MATYSSINLEKEIDLNSLFNLTYNFDLLKGVIEALVKAQKSTNQKIVDVEERLTVYIVDEKKDVITNNNNNNNNNNNTNNNNTYTNERDTENVTLTLGKDENLNTIIVKNLITL